MSLSQADSFTIEGKLALPYQYFAGSTGSRFIIALRDEKKIKGLKCHTCNKVFVPPRSTCEVCFEDISQNWVDVKDTGVVTNFTVIRYEEPHQPVKVPYILAQIKLDGADTPITHIIKGTDMNQVSVGTRVKAVFSKEKQEDLMAIECFSPFL